MTRWVRPAVALALVIVCLMPVAERRANLLAPPAAEAAQEVAVAATATYVALRMVNAALSMAQEIDVGASFFVSGNVKPLKWLEPVDDTVERMADLVFALAVVSSTLTLAVEPLSRLGFLLLALGLLAWSLPDRPWRGQSGAWGGARPLRGRLIGIGALLGLIVPLSVCVGPELGGWLTEEARAEADARLATVSDRARELIGDPSAGLVEGKPGADERSWQEVGKAYLGAAGRFWADAGTLFDSALKLAGIYILRMLVLPLVLLGSLWYILRGIQP